ncbi:hypothetical protein L2E81_12710 [Planktothrix agardhii 1033]|nr:hypothetical protein [Planktothrix agardhii 1033]
MSNLQEIESAVSQLTKEELAAFRVWFAEFDAEIWDRQFEEDVTAGRLDGLAYDQDIKKFEQTYKLDSNQFIQQFEAGILGDEMDFFEWFSLCELRQDILVKIGKLEKAL